MRANQERRRLFLMAFATQSAVWLALLIIRLTETEGMLDNRCFISAIIGGISPPGTGLMAVTTVAASDSTVITW
jgi:hypothetical protein